MPPETMNTERFHALLEAYGGTPARWPEAERAAALALLEGSAEARAARDAALRLDALLDRAPEAAPSAALMGAVLNGRPRAGGWRRLLFGAMPAWQPAAALVLAAVLGLGLGSSGSLAPADDEVVLVDVAALSLSLDTDEEAEQ